MSKLVQKVKWNLDGSNTEMYMYGEADFEANKSMQEPLEKLYQYENDNEIKEYKNKILEALLEHFDNPYCARTDIGKVMYEKEILDLVNSVQTRIEN